MRWPIVVACFALSVNLAFCQTPAREGEMEKLIILGGDDVAAWHPAEATLETQTEITRIGDSALHFHIDVNHETGEPKYPIGWPRMNGTFAAAWQQDWSDWDYLRLYIYTDTSRESLPSTPLSMNLYVPDRAHTFSRTLSELRKGEWVEFLYPLSQIPRHNEATGIQFAISESNYKHGDVLDFYIDDICLLRYGEPHISELTVRPSVSYAGGRYLLVCFRALGVAGDAEAAALVRVLDGQSEAVRQECMATRGSNEVPIFLGENGLAPGTYTVQVTLGEGVSAEHAIRVVESPWEN